MEFCDLVRNARINKKFDTPRQFYDSVDLPCTYFYYTKIERGTLPNIHVACAILRELNINMRRGLYSWVRDQMPDTESKAMFTEIYESPSRSAEQMCAQRSLVVNRKQAKLLKSDPVYWEIILFLSCYHDEKKFSAKDLSQHFKMSLSEINKALQYLFEECLLDKAKDGKYVTKEWLYIPYDSEFDGLRQSNFKRALGKFLESKDESKYRTTITRLISDRQRRQVHSYFDALTNILVDMPDDMEAEDRVPYTVGVFAAPRDFGNA